MTLTYSQKLSASLMSSIKKLPNGWRDTSGDSMGDWMPSMSTMDGAFQIYVDDADCSWQKSERGEGGYFRFTLYAWDRSDQIVAQKNSLDEILRTVEELEA
jgi:hypothetical protein